MSVKNSHMTYYFLCPLFHTQSHHILDLLGDHWAYAALLRRALTPVSAEHCHESQHSLLHLVMVRGRSMCLKAWRREQRKSDLSYIGQRLHLLHRGLLDFVTFRGSNVARGHKKSTFVQLFLQQWLWVPWGALLIGILPSDIRHGLRSAKSSLAWHRLRLITIGREDCSKLERVASPPCQGRRDGDLPQAQRQCNCHAVQVVTRSTRHEPTSPSFRFKFTVIIVAFFHFHSFSTL